MDCPKCKNSLEVTDIYGNNGKETEVYHCDNAKCTVNLITIINEPLPLEKYKALDPTSEKAKTIRKEQIQKLTEETQDDFGLLFFDIV